MAWLVHQAEVWEAEDALLSRLDDPAFDPRQVALVEQPLPCAIGPTTAQEHVRLVRRGNNTIVLNVEAAADGVLILSEVAYPGWRVFVDGERVPVVRADYALRAACVPAGAHQVVFSFVPTSLIVGAVITILTLLGVGGAAWVVFRDSRRREVGAA